MSGARDERCDELRAEAVFVPDGGDARAALARATHLGIGAHPDDVEWIGYAGIARAFGADDAHFVGCVVTDGAGSPRGGPYADASDAELVAIRHAEQRRAAIVGRYAAVVQLAHTSAATRADGAAVTDDLAALLRATRPASVFVHAPTDRHATHVAVCLRTLAALRRLDAEDDWRPERVLGVEGWGALDWLAPEDRVELDVSDRPHLFAALVGVHDSQLAGGKPYDRAMAARFRANATFAEPRAVDRCERLALAVDLGAAARSNGPSAAALVEGLCARARAALLARLDALGG